MTLLFALTLNFRHALDDCGVSKNKLHVAVLAQTNSSESSTGGSSSGGSTYTPYSGTTSNGSTTFGGSTTISVTNSTLSWNYIGRFEVKTDSFGTFVEINSSKTYGNITMTPFVNVSTSTCISNFNTSCSGNVGIRFGL